MKSVMTLLFCIFGVSFAALTAASSEDITGYWKTINEKTGNPESIVAVYEHDGKYYGRMIAIYDPEGNKVQETLDNPKTIAPGIQGGKQTYVGTDIIWDLEKDGSKFIDGVIFDPKEGKEYDAELWRDGNNLIVRGKILVFGRNQTWVPVGDQDLPKEFKKPELKSFTPKIPVKAER